MNAGAISAHSSVMHTPTRRNGCLIAIVACVPCVLCWIVMPFGDRDPSYAVTINNRTPYALAVVFSEDTNWLDGLPKSLPVGETRFYPAFSRGEHGPRRIDVYKDRSSTTSALCKGVLPDDLKTYDEGTSWITVESVGQGCRIVVQNED